MLRGRSDAGEITMFKSLGMPAEDLYPARMIYEIARANNLGVQVEF
jgi:ornithine cyclodeaminase/alanine dehydrogenase-like protein (mu-crystallin family)